MIKIITTVGFLFAFPLSSLSQVLPSDLIADIEQLEDLIETKHIRPYRLVSKKDFQSLTTNSKNVIKSKDKCDETCYVEILKVMAALNDGHSVVKPSSREKFFGYLPVTTTWFKEGLYVTRVPKEYEQILGGRLKAINGIEIDVVLNKLKGVVPHANDSRFKKFAFAYLRMPGLLFGLGITDNPNTAEFMVSIKGEDVPITFQNMSDEIYEKTKFITYDDISERLPLYRKEFSKYYWYQYDTINRIFYFKYNRIGNMEGERASVFAEKMWAKVDSLDVDKFVLDIRNNGGGQFAYSMSFTQGILDRPKINTYGKLFVVSGYDTFSAALDILRNLEVKSNAIILGEAPGDYAASSGDAKPYKLTNSEIEVQLSSRFHPTIFYGDMRKEIILDKKIENLWSDYQIGEDAIYNYIKDYKKTLSKTISVETYNDYLGSYEYDEDKNIRIKSFDDDLYIEITKSLISPLYYYKNKCFSTQIQGMTVELNKKYIKINFPDGTNKKFKRIESNKNGLDYLYDGDFEAAKVIYNKIKKKNPNSELIGDGRFSSLALFAFFELQKEDKNYASKIAKGILNLGIELNDGDAPNCEFSLRFY
jgi:hypothetical protein